MHKHFTFEERVRLEELLGQQWSQSEIAKELKRSESTISRELSRHRVNGVYVAKFAQAEAERRRCQRPIVRKMERPQIRDAVQDGLIQHWSPDEIAGRLQERFPKQPEQHISASSIYLWAKGQGPQRKHWEQYLRRRGRRPYHPQKADETRGATDQRPPRDYRATRATRGLRGGLGTGAPRQWRTTYAG